MTNINDEIKVKLTAHGKEILNKDAAKTLNALRGINLPGYAPYRVDKDGYIEFQLWDFMRIFGSHFFFCFPQ